MCQFGGLIAFQFICELYYYIIILKTCSNFCWTQVRALPCLVSHLLSQFLLLLNFAQIVGFVKVVRWISLTYLIDIFKTCWSLCFELKVLNCWMKYSTPCTTEIWQWTCVETVSWDGVYKKPQQFEPHKKFRTAELKLQIYQSLTKPQYFQDTNYLTNRWLFKGAEMPVLIWQAVFFWIIVSTKKTLA